MGAKRPGSMQAFAVSSCPFFSAQCCSFGAVGLKSNIRRKVCVYREVEILRNIPIPAPGLTDDTVAKHRLPYFTRDSLSASLTDVGASYLIVRKTLKGAASFSLPSRVQSAMVSQAGAIAIIFSILFLVAFVAVYYIYYVRPRSLGGGSPTSSVRTGHTGGTGGGGWVPGAGIGGGGGGGGRGGPNIREEEGRPGGPNIRFPGGGPNIR